MHFGLTEDQKLFEGAVREVLARTCKPDLVRRAWSDPRACDPLWATLAELGVTGLTLAEAHGGLGMGALDLAPIVEACGYAAVPLPVVETVAAAAPLLAELDTDGRFAPTLKRVSSGEARLAFGVAGEPCVAYADEAELIVLERAGELHVVPRADATLTREPSVDGARRLFRVAFERSPETRFAVGDAARALASAAEARGAVATASFLLGLARRMLDVTVEYAKIRKQFGAPIGSFQAVKHHLASALVGVELAAPLVLRAAHAVDRREPSEALYVSAAKLRASEAAEAVAKAALQCHGAIGYSFEHDLHMWMKRVWALSATWGDKASHRARAAREILTKKTPNTAPAGDRDG